MILKDSWISNWVQKRAQKFQFPNCNPNFDSKIAAIFGNTKACMLATDQKKEHDLNHNSDDIIDVWDDHDPRDMVAYGQPPVLPVENGDDEKSDQN
jgi:hypothetical protein